MKEQMVLVLIAIGGVVALGILVLIARTWRQVDQGRAMIINKMGTEPKVTFSGAIVLPIVNKMEIMDLSVKTIHVARSGKDGLICADNIRADIKVTFFVRINKTVDDVLKVAQSIGCVRASQQATLEELFSAKFSEALKTVGKRMEFEQLYTQREVFKDQSIQVIGKHLNGYVLEDVAIDYLEQTPITSLDPANVLDALGIKKITDITTTANIDTNLLKQRERMELGKQNLTGDEAIFRFEQQRAEAEAKKDKEIAIATARESNEANRFQLEEEKRTKVERERAEEAIQMAEQAKLRSVQVSEQGRVREVEVEKVRVAKARELEDVGRKRDVELTSIDMNKALETERRSIADIIRARVAVDKTVAVEEEAIKDLRVDAEAKRKKNVTILSAEGEAQGIFIKDIKQAEAEQQVAQSHAKRQLILADAAMEASDKEARAAIRRAEGAQAEAAAEGLAHVRVREADAVATEKTGMVEARIRDAQLQVTDREGTVIAENVRRKALAEAAGREAEAVAIEKTGQANAVALREKLLAEAAGQEAAAAAIEKRMRAEAAGLTEKALAMKGLDGNARAHEEFRLQLEMERTVALEGQKARIQMAEQQAKVMAETMGHADIKIIGGDGQFFDRFVRAVSLGSAIDGVVDSSTTVRKTLGGGDPGDLTKSPAVASLLAGLLGKADDGTRAKLATVLEQAKKAASPAGHDEKGT